MKTLNNYKRDYISFIKMLVYKQKFKIQHQGNRAYEFLLDYLLFFKSPLLLFNEIIAASLSFCFSICG